MRKKPMKLRTEKKLLKEFNFVSVADMVMLLLIFFLLSSSYIVQPGIKIRLPKSDTTESSSDKPITLTLTRGGAYYLNEERVSVTALPALLQQRLIGNTQQMIVIKSDRDVTIQKVIEVMDIAKQVGGERFMIGTERYNE